MIDAGIALAELPLRPELVGQAPYGAPQLDVPVRLNVNENPYPPGDKIRSEAAKAISEAVGTLNRYPDREATDLRTALARYLGFGLGLENVWAANGSNEVMTHICQAFGGPGRTLVTFTPTYSMYPEYARNTHTAYETRPRGAGYLVDADLVVDAVKETGATIVLIATPNNPTGTLTPVAVIDEICERTDAVVVVDEAYQEFTAAPDDSAIALLAKHPRLIVSRTMSKAFALAGGRLGYAAASPAVIDALRIVRLPYHLSASTQAISLVALKHSRELLGRVEELRNRCQDLQRWLRANGLDVVASQANFCLFGQFADRHAVWEALLRRGVLIRETGPEGYLRVSVGTHEETEAFQDALLDTLRSEPQWRREMPQGPAADPR